MPTIEALQKEARKLIKNSLAPSTLNKYKTHFKTYSHFCNSMNLQALPTTQDTLILFATYLSTTHSYKNIRAHISAIKFTSEMQGYDPNLSTSHRLYRVIRGIKKTQGSRFNKPPRIPITPPLLTFMGRKLWSSSINLQDKVMLWAAMLTAFHGFLRVSEYTSSHIRKYNPSTTLCFEDISIKSPQSIALHIKASKTDPFRQGTTIYLYKNNSPLCPVQALCQFMSIHPYRTGPLFTWHDGRYLTRAGLASILNRVKPQHVSSMSSHSFRIGAATTAAAAGYPRWLIQALGRWSSNCYRSYIRIPQNSLQEVSVSLSQTHHIPSLPFDPDNISP